MHGVASINLRKQKRQGTIRDLRSSFVRSGSLTHGNPSHQNAGCRRNVTTQANISRAIKAMKAADVPIGAVEIAPDGTVRVLSAMDAPKKKGQLPRAWGESVERKVSGPT